MLKVGDRVKTLYYLYSGKTGEVIEAGSIGTVVFLGFMFIHVAIDGAQSEPNDWCYAAFELEPLGA